MEGWLYKRSGRAIPSWKLRWFVLQEGSLLYYGKQGGALKGTIIVHGATIEDIDNAKTGSKPSFGIVSEGSDAPRILAAKTSAEKQAWLTALRGNTSKAAIPQSPSKVKKGAMYAVGSVAMGSKLGKSIVRKSVHSDVWLLVGDAVSFLSQYKDEATGAAFQNDVEKMITKIALLYQDKHITEEQLTSLMLLAAHLVRLCIDYYQMPSVSYEVLITTTTP
eukprot:TRINITY_DN2720_c0_g1_i6.p1 TRINITY_DN2720_c0_g1~~TRINITY_DN2720_c0_g1_i6.p1  ORF type:complete len:220 (+),score=32.30 TRINITY_DN2720_c0_g1_i6:39-698(+)